MFSRLKYLHEQQQHYRQSGSARPYAVINTDNTGTSDRPKTTRRGDAKVGNEQSDDAGSDRYASSPFIEKEIHRMVAHEIETQVCMYIRMYVYT